MQWFRNIQVYQLPPDYLFPSIEQLNENLAKTAFMHCSNHTVASQGWIAPAKHAPDIFAYYQQNALLIRLQNEEKILPASVIKQFVDDKVVEIEARDQRTVGKKERRELTDATRHELLPRAFVRRRSTTAMLDLQNHLVIIDSANSHRAEVLLSALRETLGNFPAQLIQTPLSPATAMTTWLAEETPPNFTLDSDCELRAMSEIGAIVRYQRQDLGADEVQNHLLAGKVVTKLALSWADKVSFVLTDKLECKRISILDLLADTLHEQTREEESLFDASFILMIGELRQLLAALFSALGIIKPF